MNKFIIYLIFSIATLSLLTDSYAKEIKLSGKTMGTTYHMVIADEDKKAPDNLKEIIDKNLLVINESMSTFISGSEIDQFNKYSNTDKPFNISDNFLNVMQTAEKIYKYSNGSWDGTIKPIINLWGFGTDFSTKKIPSKRTISMLLQKTGFHQIEISDNGHIIKKNPALTLDLASIAKGYAVDFIAQILKKNNLHNFLVEIGGEVYCSGQKKNQKKWKVGVNTPLEGAPYNEIYTVLTLKNKALATSGDYRNFFKKDGKLYSHVIDPKTGYPVSNEVVSASIVSNSCAFSDGMATAIMVMGQKKGLDLVNRLENTECLIIVKNENGTLVNHYSPGFQKLEMPDDN